MFGYLRSLSNQQLLTMLFKSVLILTPLVQLASAQYGCNPYGPKRAGLEAKHSPAYGGSSTTVNCNNLVDNGCPKDLPDPYGPYEKKLCNFVEEKNGFKYYTCKSANDARDFKSKAENKGWKCSIN
jgi:hypothetical protein